jgi:hypothetical protein
MGIAPISLNLTESLKKRYEDSTPKRVSQQISKGGLIYALAEKN